MKPSVASVDVKADLSLFRHFREFFDGIENAVREGGSRRDEGDRSASGIRERANARESEEE